MSNQRRGPGRPRGPKTRRYYVALPEQSADDVEAIAEDLDRSISWVLAQAVQLGLKEVADGWSVS